MIITRPYRALYIDSASVQSLFEPATPPVNVPGSSSPPTLYNSEIEPPIKSIKVITVPAMSTNGL